LTLHGFFIFFFFIPINAPIRTNGDEQHNHKSNIASIVPKGTAADDFSAHKNKSIIKKIENDMLGYKKAVSIAFFNHLSPYKYNLMFNRFN